MSVLIEDRDFAGVAAAAFVGLARGEVLRRWWDSFPPIRLMDLPGCRPDSHMRYFFSTLPIDDVPTHAVGVVQTSTFKRRATPEQPAVSLAEWVAHHFLTKASWPSAGGTRGGIYYRPAMVMDAGNSTELRRVDQDLELKLCDIGTRYAWAVVRLDMLDYMRAFPPPIRNFHRLLSPLNRECGYAVLHPDYLHTPHPCPDGCVEEYTFAYSVVPWQVMPTIAAYGAGRFHSAYKGFRFFLLEDGTVSIEVLFIVAPTCGAVLNLLGVDPVFGSARLLNAITLKRTNILKWTEFAVNSYAMGHHARLHDSLLCGMRDIWESTNWQAGGRQAARSLSRGQ